MLKIKFFLKIFLLTFILGGLAFLVFSTESVREYLGSLFATGTKQVQGIKTDRMERVNEQLAEDVGQNVETVKKDVLETTIADIVDAALRLQKIPQDIQTGKDFISEQIGNVIESKK